MREIGDRAQIHQLQHRVGRRLQQHELRRSRQRRAPLRKIGAVDELGGDAELRQQGRDDPVAGAEQRARCHHAVARLQMREQRRIHRGHAGRRGAAGFGALDQAEPLLQHRQRRIGEARILVVIDRAGERAFGLLGIVVDIARGEIQRLGGLAELAALHAAVHEAGGGAVLRGIAGHCRALLNVWPDRWSSLSPGRMGCPLASLARLFHLAAIRPDKSRGRGWPQRAQPTAPRIAASMAVDHSAAWTRRSRNSPCSPNRFASRGARRHGVRPPASSAASQFSTT